MSDTQTLQSLIETAFDKRAELTPKTCSRELIDAIETTVGLLDAGKLRVAEKLEGQWRVNQWLKKAVLLYFRTHENEVMDAGHTRFYDKVPLKYADYSAEQFRADGTRVVPQAVVRRGAYVGANAVLMPSYVNIGAYVDTWSTPGSPSAPARRSARTSISPEAWASAGCSSRCRPIRPLSKMTVSSAPARKSSKA
jgi:2,3,4,5-tetrahydropyridine-2-carboxylate N-succinyltransferase